MMFEELILWFTQYYPSDNNAHSGYYDDLLGREFENGISGFMDQLNAIDPKLTQTTNG
jgi:hypothetical protein